MIERIGIVSARQLPAPPSQPCASEFEHVLAAMLSAPILPVMAETPPEDAGFDRLIFVAMNYWQLSRMMERAAGLRRRSGPCQAYVFDSFHRYLSRWTARFPSPLRPAARLLRHELRNVGKMTRIFVPTGSLIEEQQAYLDATLSYLPIGVDAVRFGSMRVDRTIDVNAYGRQPRAMTDFLSDTLNVRDGNYRFSHTDHFATITLRDPERHRALFWRSLTDSRVALAYEPKATGGDIKFDCALVGQRWFESIAAGCAVMGRKPPTAETDLLFDWPDALIELADDPEEALAQILTVVHDPARLAAIARRNYRAALLRHDWRHRVDVMATELGIERDDTFEAIAAQAGAMAAAIS